MKKLLAVIGMPGTGKSTLMKKFIGGISDFQPHEPVKLVSGHLSKEHNLFLIGKYAEGNAFPGTDVLSMAVQPAAIEYCKTCTTNVIFEGDRLSSQTFLESALDNFDEVKIIYLVVSDATRTQRYADRGSEQSEVFLKGRTTKYAGINSNFLLMDSIVECRNENYDDQGIILNMMNEFLETDAPF